MGVSVVCCGCECDVLWVCCECVVCCECECGVVWCDCDVVCGVL